MPSRKILITGIAGFIGCNTADYYLKKNKQVVGIDNLSRGETKKNLKWLKEKHPIKWKFYLADIRDRRKMFSILRKEMPDAVIHLAAQVAVTASVKDPIADKEINIDGTLNLLEAVRATGKKISFIYSSTNKVYGGLEEHSLREKKERYVFRDKKLDSFGISEFQLLDFHSPYGCSKGAAGQYVRDYFRIYGIPTVVFRQSCIYGRRQFGNEDQGWVMHFVRRALEGKEIKIFGNGKQVRDLLEISDLVRLFDIALKKISETNGQIYNVGGGPKLNISLLELIGLLEKNLGSKIKASFHDWRTGDQRIYVSDIRAAKKLGWYPRVGIDQGIKQLIKWGSEILGESKVGKL